MQISTNLIFREDSSFFKMFHLKQITFCAGTKKIHASLHLKKLNFSLSSDFKNAIAQARTDWSLTS